jgi:hypothetical protein
LLISQTLDGLEIAQATAQGRLVVQSSPEALTAVSSLRADLASRYCTLPPDALDGLLSGSARLVRRMAALIATTDGATEVSGTHQEIAIAAATDSARGAGRYLLTGRWIA